MGVGPPAGAEKRRPSRGGRLRPGPGPRGRPAARRGPRRPGPRGTAGSCGPRRGPRRPPVSTSCAGRVGRVRIPSAGRESACCTDLLVKILRLVWTAVETGGGAAWKRISGSEERLWSLPSSCTDSISRGSARSALLLRLFPFISVPAAGASFLTVRTACLSEVI